MNTRYDELRSILHRGGYFKIVCGAGNEDPDEVRELSFIYTLAGATGIDVSANVDVVEAACEGVDKACASSGDYGMVVEHRPFVNVSIGLKGDPHVRKARIRDETCTACGQCAAACEQEAIGVEDSRYAIREYRCIGCGACGDICPTQAIEYYTRECDYESLLPACIEGGAETLELHAIIPDDDKVMRDWRMVARHVPDNFISMCLDRSQLSDVHLMKRIVDAYGVAGDRLIIQADGAPMSGGSDDYRTTLQAVAIAEIVEKNDVPAMLLLSGGTNSKTGDLAKLCGLRVNGVSIGTYARKIVRPYLEGIRRGDMNDVKKALDIARKLVRANLEYIEIAS